MSYKTLSNLQNQFSLLRNRGFIPENYKFPQLSTNKNKVPARSKISNRKRTKVFENNKYRCVKCDTYKDLCVDHILPISLGGSNDLDNLQTLCNSCNCKKGVKENLEFMK